MPAGGDDDEAVDRRVRAALDSAVAAYAPQIAEATARYRAATGALLAALNEASASDRCVVNRRMSHCCGGWRMCCALNYAALTLIDS